MSRSTLVQWGMSAGALTGAAAAMVGCAGESVSESVSSSSQAVFGGRADAVTPEDAVVAIAPRQSGLASATCDGGIALPDERCNGVLVTPGLVLTTKECTSLFGPSTPLDIYVGRKASTMQCRYPVRRTLATQPGSVSAQLDGQHLAVLELSKPLLTGEAVPLRPTTLPFDALAVGAGTDSLRYSAEGVRMIGWSSYDGEGARSNDLAGHRQTAELAVSAFARLSGAANVLLTNAYDQGDAPMRGLGKDDFGAALFLRDRSTQAWVLAGLGASPKSSMPYREAFVPPATGCNTPSAPGYPSYNLCDGWVDLMATPTRTWLSASLREAYGDARPRWTRMHQALTGAAERWVGERDYVGRCQRDKDADCDYWFDGAEPEGRDNCPNLPNGDQLDVEDDGIGDACDSTEENAQSLVGTWRSEADGVILTLIISLEGGTPKLHLVGIKRLFIGAPLLVSGQVGGPLTLGNRTLRITYDPSMTDATGELILGRFDNQNLRYRVLWPDQPGEAPRLEILDGGLPNTFVKDQP